MIKLPTAFQVSECIRKITRRESSVIVLAKPGVAKLLYGGTFHGGDRTVIAMCAADIAFAAYSGAAMPLIPGDSAQERVDAGVLDEMLQENFAEVLNLLTRVFVVPETARVALLEPIFPPRAMPQSLVLADSSTPIVRADYEIQISAYGKGYLALWSRG